MTKFIKLPDGNRIYYPVGESMKNNILRIREMGISLKAYLIAQGINFDDVVLIATGTSGSIISAIIAADLGLDEIRYVRKEGENQHYGHTGLWKLTQLDKVSVIVDDFIDSGKSYLRMYNAFLEANDEKPSILLIGKFTSKNVMAYLYNQDKLPPVVIANYSDVVAHKYIKGHSSTMDAINDEQSTSLLEQMIANNPMKLDDSFTILPLTEDTMPADIIQAIHSQGH